MVNFLNKFVKQNKTFEKQKINNISDDKRLQITSSETKKKQKNKSKRIINRKRTERKKRQIENMRKHYKNKQRCNV